MSVERVEVIAYLIYHSNAVNLNPSFSLVLRRTVVYDSALCVYKQYGFAH